MHFYSGLVAISLLLLGCRSVIGETISFDGLVGSNGTPFTSIIEDGFTVDATQGEWRIGQSSGHPIPSIFSSSPNAQIEVTGLPFNFISMETNDGAIATGTSSASYQVEGFLNNHSVLFGSGSISPQYQTNFSPDSFQVLDRLLITINRGNTSSYNIDDIVLRQVPEPSTCSLAIAILVVTGLVQVKRIRRTMFPLMSVAGITATAVRNDSGPVFAISDARRRLRQNNARLVRS